MAWLSCRPQIARHTKVNVSTDQSTHIIAKTYPLLHIMLMSRNDACQELPARQRKRDSRPNPAAGSESISVEGQPMS